MFRLFAPSLSATMDEFPSGRSVPQPHAGMQPRPASCRCRKTAGITLIEILFSLVVLGIGAVSAIPCLLSANRQAAVNRLQSTALGLCQERVEQGVAATFLPPTTIPSFYGTTWPVPATDTVTATETVQLCADESGTSRITGTRTTLVSLGNATLNTVRLTVRVNYKYRGKDYLVQTYALRSPD